jgi:LmbE family N-acetylglucosaminyl deacetylase
VAGSRSRSAAAEFLQKPISAGDLITKAAELVRAGRKARAKGREIVLAIGAHPDDVEIGYQSPSATVDYRPTHFVTIDDYVERKLRAIDAFGSQTGVRDYLEPGLIASTARYWSRYCGGSHAEPFEAIRDRAGSQLVTR